MIEAFSNYYKSCYEEAKEGTPYLRFSNCISKTINFIFYYLVFVSFPVLLILPIFVGLKGIKFEYSFWNNFFNFFEEDWIYKLGFFHFVLTILFIIIVGLSYFFRKKNKSHIQANMRFNLMKQKKDFKVELSDIINNHKCIYKLEKIDDFEKLNKLIEFKISEYKKDAPKFNFAFLSLIAAITLGLSKFYSDSSQRDGNYLESSIIIIGSFIVGLLVYFVGEKLNFLMRYHSKEKKLREVNEFILQIIFAKNVLVNEAVSLNSTTVNNYSKDMNVVPKVKKQSKV